jgi:hypothetical protein
MTAFRRYRAPLVVGFLVLLVAIVVVAVGQRTVGALNPGSAEPGGSRALATLLRDRGVTVIPVSTTSAAVAASTKKTTVLITDPELLAPSQLHRIAMTAGDLVLVQPIGALGSLAPEVTPVDTVPVIRRDPGCDLSWARDAGDADLGGTVYDVPTTALTTIDLCYAVEGHASLLRVRSSRRAVTILGSGTPLTNERLARRGNAALSLRLLGTHPRLVWFMPTVADIPPGERRGVIQLLPAGVKWAVIQLMVAVFLAAAWRGRRFGPMVPERLPVAVRAAETTEGAARLYARARARGVAAAALRHAALSRILPRLRFSEEVTDPSAIDAVVPAVAARTGQAIADVTDRLYGPEPATDATLIQLATDLDRLAALDGKGPPL